MGSSRVSACDFFVWGYLKSKVYVRKPRTVDDLNVSIRKEIATVTQEMLVNVMQNFEERLRKCVRQEGRHLSDIIFRNWLINVSNQNCIYYRFFGINIIFYIENKKVTIIWKICVLFAPLCVTYGIPWFATSCALVNTIILLARWWPCRVETCSSVVSCII